MVLNVKMERIDIREMNKAKARNRALKLFEDLKPNEALVVVSSDEPKLIYDSLKEKQDFDKESYEVTKKGKKKYVAVFLKR